MEMSRASSESNSSISGGSSRALPAEEEEQETETFPVNEESSSADVPARQRRDSCSSWSSCVPDDFTAEEEEDLETEYMDAPRDCQGVPDAIIRPIRPVIGPRARGNAEKESRHRAAFSIPTCTGRTFTSKPKTSPFMRPQTNREAGKIIIDYLISEGYKKEVELLCKESKIELPIDEMKHLDERVDIKQATIKGDLGKAIDLVKEYCPGLIESHSEVRFNLYQQNMIEMIRIKAVDEVLAYAEEHISTDEELAPDQLDRFEKTFALLAFENPTESPFNYLLNLEHRQQIATEVNSAVLRYQNRPPAPRLEVLLQMTIWAEQQVLGKDSRNNRITVAQLASTLFGDKPPSNSAIDMGTSI